MALEMLDKMLDEHHARANQLSEQLDAVRVQISALETARNALARPLRDKWAKKRSRTLKREWAELLRHIGEAGKVSLDDSEDYLRSNNIDVNRNTLRSQMALYANEGWLRRVDKGVFELTGEGAAKVGFGDHLECQRAR